MDGNPLLAHNAAVLPPASPARVLLADDHAVVRAGLRNALASLPQVEVVGEVADGLRLLEELAALRPDFLVVDVNMPHFDPVTTVRRIKAENPALKILVVSAFDDEAYVVGLLDAGVDGYHLKDQPLTDLQLAAQRILAGERWISGPLVSRLLHRQAAPPPRALPAPPLTRRQRELARLLMQGFDNRRLAQTMELSVKTVENHLTALYRALGVDSRLEATRYLTQHPEALALTGHETADPPPASRTGPTLTVLVVDDNARYRQQLLRVIGKTLPSVQLYEAEEIAEALRVAERVKPQLALIDVVLRDEDGIQCARRLKALSPNTRMVLISAYPDREFRRLGLNAGAVAFLDKKDIDAGVVKQVIEDALGA